MQICKFVWNIPRHHFQKYLTFCIFHWECEDQPIFDWDSIFTSMFSLQIHNENIYYLWINYKRCLFLDTVKAFAKCENTRAHIIKLFIQTSNDTSISMSHNVVSVGISLPIYLTNIFQSCQENKSFDWKCVKLTKLGWQWNVETMKFLFEAFSDL